MPSPKGQTAMIHLQLTCLKAPDTSRISTLQAQEATVFGLQDRQQQIHLGQQNADGSLLYDLQVPIARIAETGKVRFQGPFVHGTRDVPFLYLSLKRAEEVEPTWIIRLKIPLPTLDWDDNVNTVNAPLYTARIAGSGSGTVPLLDGGWHRQE
jgi:hypothetical protein